jgi:hypothetical protein
MQHTFSRRRVIGAAGAFAGGSVLTGTVAAAALPSGTDAELFALLAEEDRFWIIASQLQEDAETRVRKMPQGRVEIGQQTVEGRTRPIYAASEEELASWFDAEPKTGLRAELNRLLDIETDLYLDRRDEFLSVIREQATARADALRAAGVDKLEASAKGWLKRASAVSEKIDGMQPKTIPGAIALLECDVHDRTEHAIAGLRNIATEARS